MNMVPAYTLIQHDDTRELHLFEGEMMPDNKCTSARRSICQKMTKQDGYRRIFSCLDEDAARSRCAQEGREVCGICVSHLYANYED
jgi:hypothetical protein